MTKRANCISFVTASVNNKKYCYIAVSSLANKNCEELRIKLHEFTQEQSAPNGYIYIYC